MMYLLVSVFMPTMEFYVERRDLSLEACAGWAAIMRQETKQVEDHVGEFFYMCVEQVDE